MQKTIVSGVRAVVGHTFGDLMDAIAVCQKPMLVVSLRIAEGLGENFVRYMTEVLGVEIFPWAGFVSNKDWMVIDKNRVLPVEVRMGDFYHGVDCVDRYIDDPDDYYWSSDMGVVSIDRTTEEDQGVVVGYPVEEDSRDI